jgi:hypothetical protein
MPVVKRQMPTSIFFNDSATKDRLLLIFFNFFVFCWRKQWKSGILNLRRCQTNTEKCKRILPSVEGLGAPTWRDRKIGKQWRQKRYYTTGSKITKGWKAEAPRPRMCGEESGNASEFAKAKTGVRS